MTYNQGGKVMMKNLKLSVKLVGSFILVSVITLIVGFVGVYGISTSEKIADKVAYTENIAKQMLQREIDHLNWARKVGLFQRDDSMTSLGVETDERKCNFGKWYYSDDRKMAEEEIPPIKSFLSQIEDPHTKLHKSAQAIELILKKGKAFRPEAVALYGGETSQHLKNVQNLLGEIRPRVENHAKKSDEAARNTLQHITTIAWISMLAGAIIALIFGIFLSRSIVGPIRRIIAGITDGSEQVAAASTQVSSSSQQLAEGASEQAASLEETSSSIEELTSMTKQNADHAQQAKAMMKEVQRIVQNVNDNMKNMAEAIADVTKSSEETIKIIKTIDEIAFQTNLLALNAAVEAARAGEAGAGFAVVADEVRNLAMRAAEAAKNTSNLIENTIKGVKNGNELTGLTQEAFKENVKIAGKIGNLIDEIAAASQEQSQGINQINIAVAEMDKVTQQTAASAEESASASEELNAQAEQMKGYVYDLAALIGGEQDGVVVESHSEPSSKKLRNLVHAKMEAKAPIFHKGKIVMPDQLMPMAEGNFKDF
jgi:methyl-accepting chemotaxis protein